MNNKEILQIKAEALKNQMEELSRLREFDCIQDYKIFKNIFLDDVRIYYDYMEKAFDRDSKRCYINEEDKLFMKDIYRFINNEIEIFSTISDCIIKECRVNKNGECCELGILPENHSIKYKYCQQIINDYIRFTQRFGNNILK